MGKHMNNFLKEVDKIGRDLLNLEITTILADNISAEKMPDAGIAIKQVAATYYSIISKHKKELVAKDHDTFLSMQDREKIQLLFEEQPR
jgi:hypothetical protein